MDDQLAADLIVLWQSELTAMSADRELREVWAMLLAIWANSAMAASRMLPAAGHDRAAGSTVAAEPARPAAAAAASGPGAGPDDDELQQLRRRVARLEQRLGEWLVEGDKAGGG